MIRGTGAQRGSAALLVLASVAVAVALLAAIGAAAPSLVERARADAVADVAALAGVSGAPAAARTVAERSGASDISVTANADGTVVVHVVVGGHRAVATAAPAGSEWVQDPVDRP